MNFCLGNGDCTTLWKCLCHWIAHRVANGLLLFSRSAVSYLCYPMDFSMPGFPVLHYLLEFAQTHIHWLGDANQPSQPLSSPSPPVLNLSQHQGLFQWVSVMWPKYWSLTISPFNEYSGLISFRIDWFDRLAVQGILKSLLQHQFWRRIWKHQFFSAQTSLWSNSHIQTWLLEKT